MRERENLGTSLRFSAQQMTKDGHKWLIIKSYLTAFPFDAIFPFPLFG